MLKQYKRFEKNELEDIFEKLSKEEKQVIKDYIEYRSINCAKRKLGDIRRHVIQFRFITEKKFNDIDLKDLRGFLSVLSACDREIYTKNEIKANVKNFLKWKFRDWSERFEDLRDIKLQDGHNEKKINSSTILQKIDIEKLTKGEEKLFWKTFFICLYESGVRPVELRLLKWGDITFNVNGDLTELKIYATKTGKARVVYVKEATYFLQRLREESKNKSLLVFPSPTDNNKPLTKNAVSLWLSKLSQKVLNRRINPYLIRHSRATELYNLAKQNKISKDSVLMFMGHGADMTDIYTHLNKDEIKNILCSQIYQLQDLPVKKKHELELRIEAQDRKIEDLSKTVLKFSKIITDIEKVIPKSSKHNL